MIFDVHDFEVKLSVMVLYCDGNDQSLVTWLWPVILEGKLCIKRGESHDSEGWKFSENSTSFVIKLEMIAPLTNYDYASYQIPSVLL